jgi:hypothetical protein
VTDQLYVSATDLTVPLRTESEGEGLAHYALARHAVLGKGATIYASELADGFQSDLLVATTEDEVDAVRATIIGEETESPAFLVRSG